MEEHLGKIVRVRISDITSADFYKIRGVITDGSLRGSECVVGYEGDARKIKSEEIIARLRSRRESIDSKIDLYGNFITSNVPRDFSEANYNEVIFIGDWEKGMEERRAKKQFSLPLVDDISYFYNIDGLVSFLFYRRERGRIKKGRNFMVFGYEISKERAEKKTRKDKTQRPVKYVFRRYVGRLEKRYPLSPKVVIVNYQTALASIESEIKEESDIYQTDIAIVESEIKEESDIYQTDIAIVESEIKEESDMMVLRIEPQR